MPTREPLNRRFLLALLLSTLLHLGLILGLKISHIVETKPIEVSLIRPQRQQIVSPSATTESKPVESNRLSDKDTSTPVETIKRGETEKPVSAVKSQMTASKPLPPASENTPKESVKQSASQAPTLKLSDDTLLSQFAAIQPESKEATAPPKKLSDTQRQSKFSQAEPFQRSELSIFRQGSPDFLPDIKDGDLTLLNAKADRHAIFVRRVALQVFGALRSLSWQELNGAQINSLQKHSIIEAIMDPKGKLLSVSLQSPSGSAAFDSIVEKAATDGTWDQNPPVSAQAADGNIHFIFYSKSWSRFYGNTMREQRWIMLGTGLL